MNSLGKQRAELAKRLNQSKDTGTLVKGAVEVSKQTSREDVRKLASIRMAHDNKERQETVLELMSY